MIVTMGDALAHAWALMLLSGEVMVKDYGVLHHTLAGCAALAHWIDPVTPYLVACVAR